MSVLPLIMVLIIVLDKYCFTHVLQRPLITCTLLGACLGHTTEAMIVGGTLELYYIGYEAYGEYAPVSSSFFISSLTATYLVSNGTDSTTAISTASSILALGLCMEYLLSLVNLLFVPSIRNDAEKTNIKSIGVKMFVSVVVACIAYVAYAYVLSSKLDSIQTTLTTFVSTYPYVLAGIHAVAILMPCIAFAILLRNIGFKDVPGAFFGGIAFGLLLLSTTTSTISGTIVACIAIALACYDFHHYQNESIATNQKEEVKVTNTIKGGAEKWW